MTGSQRLSFVLKRIKEKPEEILVLDKPPVPEKVMYEDVFLETACEFNRQVKRRKNSVEWMGYILADKTNPTVASDIIMEEEECRSTKVDISVESKFNILKRMEGTMPGHTIIGCIHYYNQPHSFSKDDRENTQDLSKVIALNTRRIYKLVDLQLSHLGLLTDDNTTNLLLKEYGDLISVSMEELSKHDLGYVLKATTRGTPVALSDVTNLKLFLPYTVGWCYNIIVSDKTVLGDKKTVYQKISVIEGIEGLPKTEDLFRDIELDDPIITGRKVDVENVVKEVERCIKPPTITQGIKSILHIGEIKTGVPVDVKEAGKMIQGRGVATEEKFELTPGIYRGVLANVIRYGLQIDSVVLSAFEKLIGFQIFDETKVKQMQEYVEMHSDIVPTIQQLYNAKTAFEVENAIKGYMKK